MWFAQMIKQLIWLGWYLQVLAIRTLVFRMHGINVYFEKDIMDFIFQDSQVDNNHEDTKQR